MLLHVTSAPGAAGGDLGPAAHAFVDFLAAAQQSWWQVLPLSPPGKGGSPYSTTASMAGNPALVAIEPLVQAGWLTREDLREFHQSQPRLGSSARMDSLRRAWARARSARTHRNRLQEFSQQERAWLDDYALHAVLQHRYRAPWPEWPRPLRRRDGLAIAEARQVFASELEFLRFVQFEFVRQMGALREACAARRIKLIGDLPIFVSWHSADVWAHQELFQLDRKGSPRVVSGVPPDLFSADGQIWEHPLYHWPAHKATGYAWWKHRFMRALRDFDLVRVDHFLGFHRLWAVPAGARTARRGAWLPTPGRTLLNALSAAARRARPGSPQLPILAEDLGVLVPAAAALRDEFGLPGMRVLQFGFGDESDYHRPHAWPIECVAYTGTHDNDTLVGWYASLRRKSRQAELSRLLTYLAGPADPPTPRALAWHMIGLLHRSAAQLAIVPVQDLLGLDSRARMNHPGRASGNWRWQLKAGALSAELAERLSALTTVTGRWPGNLRR